jgi:hypothetical protein
LLNYYHRYFVWCQKGDEHLCILIFPLKTRHWIYNPACICSRKGDDIAFCWTVLVTPKAWKIAIGWGCCCTTHSFYEISPYVWTAINFQTAWINVVINPTGLLFSTCSPWDVISILNDYYELSLCQFLDVYVVQKQNLNKPWLYTQLQ